MADLCAITGIGLRQQDEQGHFVLVLEDDHERTLLINIGFCEAKAIQMVLDKETFPRPLTHDLFTAMVEQLNVSILRVIIDDFSHKTFFSRLLINSPDGQVSLDCRPSDGIALALRVQAPVLVSEMVMTAAQRPKK